MQARHFFQSGCREIWQSCLTWAFSLPMIVWMSFPHILFPLTASLLSQTCVSSTAERLSFLNRLGYLVKHSSRMFNFSSSEFVVTNNINYEILKNLKLQRISLEKIFENIMIFTKDHLKNVLKKSIIFGKES